MKKFYLFSILIALGISVSAQTVTLTFTGKDAKNNWVHLNRVVITNQTRNWSETIVWPDTTLTMQNVTGIENRTINGGLTLSQNNPNPFNGTTDVMLSVADAGAITMEIADVNGRIVETQNFTSLSIGNHQFRLSLPSAGTYVMTVRQNGKTSAIKMMSNGGGNGKRIEHTGMVEENHYSPLQTKSGTRGVTTNPFAYGDMMEYVMYATINGSEDSVIVSQQQSDAQEIVMAFETVAQTDGFPCPGTPTLTDIDGNVYNTVMLGQQCWMKENLRTTRFADGGGIPSIDTLSSITPYRYAPNGEVANVATYGYLYNWAAVMHEADGSNSNPSGVQGICPDGWHVPSDAEWTQLTDYVGSREEYVCGVNNNNLIGKALAATTGWNTSDDFCAVGNDPSSNNATGFSVLPAGSFGTGDVGANPNYYHNFSNYAIFWSATEHNATYSIWLILRYNSAGVTPWNWGSMTKVVGGSVRCVRD